MKWFIYILIIVAVVVLQQSFFNIWYLGPYTPDLLLLISLAIVLATNNFDFLLFALLGGFWTEVSYGLPVGSLIVSLIITGSLAYLIINRWLFSDKSWQHFFGAVAIGTIVLHLWLWIYTSMLFIFGWSEVAITGKMFLQSLLPSLFVNLLCTYPIFAGVEVLVGFIQKRMRPSVIKI